MKHIIATLILLGSVSSFAETLTFGVYSQVGSVTEFCHVNSAYVFVNGQRVVSNANLGEVFELEVPATGKLVLRDASVGRSHPGACDKLIIQREDGSELKVDRLPGTINFEVEL